MSGNETEKRPLLIGYTDRLSVRAGESVDVKVSSGFSSDYEADLVRIFSADPNPDGPGTDIRPVPAAFEGSYRSVAKPSRPGSYGVIPLGGAGLVEDATFSIRFQPRLLREAPQVLFSFVAEPDAVSVGIRKNGLSLEAYGDASAIPFAFEIGGWYELRLAIGAGRLHLVGYSVETGARCFEVQTELQSVKPEFSTLVLAAAPHPEDATAFTSFFNGRLESPTLLCGPRLPESLFEAHLPKEDIVAAWDFAVDIPTPNVRDRGPSRLDGTLHNLPARAVRGSRWSGNEMCWRHAPEEYAAIHFHEGDIYDCGWETDFRFDVPDDLPSGVYGIRLRCGDAEDIIPFFIRPERDAAKAKVAVLFSTFTYLAYSNYPRTNFGDAYIERREAWHACPNHPAEHPQFGRSLYDVHTDGSGVMFSSMMRPQLLMRPGFFAYLDDRGSGLRHFPADMHLIAWCAAKGIPVDIVTDHDLDAEGTAAIDDYTMVLTVTHPEYHTARTLDAIQDYIRNGGNFAYLGGNGFYWRVATSPHYPGAIELRRGESGVRMWETEPGECYQAFDGQFGGLWLKNDRPPQRLVGIGMSAQGPFDASFYRRSEASYDSRFGWLFEGINDDIIGDFGFSGGGAAGFELDVVDHELGSPPATVVLAVSESHSEDYAVVPEKLWNPDVHFSRDWQETQIRADLSLVPQPKGNYVLSTGSIMFCGSLPINGFDNNVSQLLANFVHGCLGKDRTA